VRESVCESEREERAHARASEKETLGWEGLEAEGGLTMRFGM